MSLESGVQTASKNATFKKRDSVAMVSHRVPPHSLDAEQALLACCIIDGGQESITACIEAKIRKEAFFKPAHQIIFSALLSLYKEGTPVDEIILAEKLQSTKQLQDINGHAYISELTDRIATTAHLKHYIDIVRNAFLLRRLIRVSGEAIEEAHGDQSDVGNFLEKVEQEIFKISEDRISDSGEHVGRIMDDAVTLIYNKAKGKGDRGVPTGFVDLDKMTGGFKPQQMIVVAARPSQGKTTISLNMAEAAIFNKNAENKECPVLIFSLEMSAEELAMKLLCGRARIDMEKVQAGFFGKEVQADLIRTANEFKKAPLWIDDSPGLTILELRAKARRIHAQRKLGMVVIDYLQLISGTDTKASREQQIAEISRGIKAMAKELNIPVLVAGQLNRESEKEGRQPKLSDLRESGAIEQDADIVLLISRKKDANEDEERMSSVIQRDLIVAKQRNGPIGLVPLTFIKNLTRFENATSREINV